MFRKKEKSFAEIMAVFNEAHKDLKSLILKRDKDISVMKQKLAAFETERDKANNSRKELEKIIGR